MIRSPSPSLNPKQRTPLLGVGPDDVARVRVEGDDVPEGLYVVVVAAVSKFVGTD